MSVNESSEREIGQRRRRGIERLSRDRSTSILWATILVWGAVVLAIELMLPSDIEWWNSGGIFLIGAGAVVLLEGLYRVIKAEFQRRLLFRFILGMVLLGAGLATIFPFHGNVAPIIILLMIAGAILLNSYFRKTTGQ